MISSVLLTGLMLMNYTSGLVSAFTFVLLLATLTTLVPYALSAAAQAHLYLTEPELFEGGRFARDVLIAASRSSTRPGRSRVPGTRPSRRASCSSSPGSRSTSR